MIKNALQRERERRLVSYDLFPVEKLSTQLLGNEAKHLLFLLTNEQSILNIGVHLRGNIAAFTPGNCTCIGEVVVRNITAHIKKNKYSF